MKHGDSSFRTDTMLNRPTLVQTTITNGKSEYTPKKSQTIMFTKPRPILPLTAGFGTTFTYGEH